MNDGHVATATVIQFPVQSPTAPRRVRPRPGRPASLHGQAVRRQAVRRQAGPQAGRPEAVRAGARALPSGRPARRCPTEPPLRLTRRGRIVVVVAVAVAACALLSLVLATASASAGPAYVPPRTHVVQPGETLWEIAFELDPSTDTRVVVARVAELNRLASVDVEPGQALLLPSTERR